MTRMGASTDLLRAHSRLFLLNLPHFDVFAQNPWTRFSAKHVAEFIHSTEFRTAARLRPRVAALVENEVLDPAVQRIADPDTLLKTRIVDIVRLRVEDIDEVIVIDGEGDTARHPKLVPRRQILPFLVEDLDPRIGPVADKQPSSFVHGNAMHWRAELARAVSGFSPGLDELSVLR